MRTGTPRRTRLALRASAVGIIRGILASPRLVDWRFLVPRSNRGDEPGPEPFARLLVLGTDAPRVAATAALCRSLQVADDVVEHRGGPAGVEAGPVDLVVALGSPWAEVRAVLPALEPGGVLYWEADARTGAGPGLRRLRREGLTATAYRRRRHGAHDTLFLPLGPRRAAGWYVDELVDDGSRARRLVRRLAGASTAATRRAVTTAGGPVSWVAVRGKGVLTPDVLADLDLGLDAGDGSCLPVVLTRGEGEWSRVVLLPFGDRDDRPRGVVKLPRLARHGEATQRERRLLAELAETLPEAMAASVPTPLAGGTWRGLPLAVESYLPGRPIGYGPRLGDAAGRDDLLRAADWVAGLHRPSRPPTATAPTLDATLDRPRRPAASSSVRTCAPASVKPPCEGPSCRAATGTGTSRRRTSGSPRTAASPPSTGVGRCRGAADRPALPPPPLALARAPRPRVSAAGGPAGGRPAHRRGPRRHGPGGRRGPPRDAGPAPPRRRPPPRAHAGAPGDRPGRPPRGLRRLPLREPLRRPPGHGGLDPEGSTWW